MMERDPLAIGPASRPWRWVIVTGVVLGGLALAPGAAMVVAQTVEADATGIQTAAAEGRVPTIIELFQASTTSVVINSILLAMSVLAMLLWLYLMMALTSRGLNPPRFIDNVTKLILNRQFDQAIHLCQTHGHAFTASIIQRMIENRERDHASLIEILSAEGRRRAEPIWNRINYLSEIANIAPMLGLFGTVLGMIDVFFTLTQTVDLGTDRATALAGGIGVAMGTTMFGLIVALMAAVFYTMARSRATAVLAEAEQICHKLADDTARVSVDPRLKKIDALADAARQKIAMAAAARGASGGGPAAPVTAPSGYAPAPRPPQR